MVSSSKPHDQCSPLGSRALIISKETELIDGWNRSGFTRHLAFVPRTMELTVACHKLKATYHIYLFKPNLWSESFANVRGEFFFPLWGPKPKVHEFHCLTSAYYPLRPVDQPPGALSLRVTVERAWKNRKKEKTTWPKAFSIYYIGKFNLIYWKVYYYYWQE